MTLLAGTEEAVRRDAAALIRSSQRIAVLAHVNPDADAIGSVLGVALGLQALGKDAVPALSDRVPDYASFLPGTAGIVSVLPDHEFDLFIFADSADIARVGTIYTDNPERFPASRLINIDHHRTNPLYGGINYVDPTASSTSELAYRLLQTLQAPIDAAIADALLFGITGDTGSFRNGATTPGSLQVAADLVAAGGDIQRIAFQLFECKTFGAARLWGRVISGISLDRQRGIVVACLSQEMLTSEGVTVDETEGIAEYLRGIQEAEVVMLLKETEDGDIRVSMRSRARVDVSLIATALGGGGHRQAAGCTLPGPFSRAAAILIQTFDRSNPQ